MTTTIVPFSHDVCNWNSLTHGTRKCVFSILTLFLFRLVLALRNYCNLIWCILRSKKCLICTYGTENFLFLLSSLRRTFCCESYGGNAVFCLRVKFFGARVFDGLFFFTFTFRKHEKKLRHWYLSNFTTTLLAHALCAFIGDAIKLSILFHAVRLTNGLITFFFPCLPPFHRKK